MSRRPRRTMPPTSGATPVRRLEAENFARKLHEALIKNDMRASDLARLLWGETTNKEGHRVAKNRDRISVYLAGKQIPDAHTLRKLAEALNMEEAELAPDIVQSTVERENPELSMTMIAGHSDKVYLRVNKLMPLDVATQIINLVNEAEKRSAIGLPPLAQGVPDPRPHGTIEEDEEDEEEDETPIADRPTPATVQRKKSGVITIPKKKKV